MRQIRNVEPLTRPRTDGSDCRISCAHLISFRNLALAAGLAVFVCSQGCRPVKSPAQSAPPYDPALLDGARALDEVRALVAIGPRDAGTDGARRAAEHLAGRLRELGLDPIVDEFLDPTPAGETMFRNVEAVIPGAPDRWVLLGSHFDTKRGVGPGFEGANDSGSSSGLLLELARVLVQGQPGRPSVVLAFFDGEECMREYGPRDGFHGSRRLAARWKSERKPEEVLAVIVLDMIGDRDLRVEIPRNGSTRLIAKAFDAAAELGVRSKFGLMNGVVSDDHQAFLDAGFPAMLFIDFNYGSGPGLNDYWHTPQDTLDNISAESLQTVGRVVLATLNRLWAGTQ